MLEHQKRVKEFMQLAKQDTPDAPMIQNASTRKLRSTLLLEEVTKAVDALGFEIIIRTSDGVGHNLRFCDLELEPQYNIAINLEDVAKELADISVVNVGTAVALGLDLEPILEEVDANNLAKFGPGGHRREDGKWIKPPNHQPPNIKEQLERQGYTTGALETGL